MIHKSTVEYEIGLFHGKHPVVVKFDGKMSSDDMFELAFQIYRKLDEIFKVGAALRTTKEIQGQIDHLKATRIWHSRIIIERDGAISRNKATKRIQEIDEELMYLEGELRWRLYDEPQVATPDDLSSLSIGLQLHDTPDGSRAVVNNGYLLGYIEPIPTGPNAREMIYSRTITFNGPLSDEQVLASVEQMRGKILNEWARSTPPKEPREVIGRDHYQKMEDDEAKG